MLGDHPDLLSNYLRLLTLLLEEFGRAFGYPRGCQPFCFHPPLPVWSFTLRSGLRSASYRRVLTDEETWTNSSLSKSLLWCLIHSQTPGPFFLTGRTPLTPSFSLCQPLRGEGRELIKSRDPIALWMDPQQVLFRTC